MRNYIILNNQNSNTISGLIIQELAPISKPLQRTQVETIDGRDGDIVTPLGYAAYNKKIKIGLYGNFDINEVIAYFATKGTVIFSNEPDKYYYYQIVDQIDYERLVRYRVATVTMHVQPFKYSATEGTITVDASDTVSGDGSDIALDGTAEAPFNVLRHKGNATQTTYTGKNLVGLAHSPAQNQVLTSVTISNQTDDSVTLTAQNATYACLHLYYNVKAGTYTASLKSSTTDTSFTPRAAIYKSGINVVSGINQTTSKTFTLNEDAMIDIRLFASADTASSRAVTFYDFQLEAGSSPSPFEPYVGNLPSPSPDYPQDIQVVTGESTVKITGKNLFDDSTLYHGYYMPSAPYNKLADEKYRTAEIELKAGTYTFSCDLENCYILRLFADGENITINTAKNSHTFTTTTDGRVMVCFRNTSTSTITQDVKCQLELGGQATDYEEFKGQSYVIPFGDTYLAKIGDYADEPVKVDGAWYIRRAIGKVAATDFNNSSNLSGGGVRYYTPNEYGGKSSTQEVLTMSSHFIGCSHANRGAALNTAYVNGNMGVSMDTTMTLNQFKTWFANNNVDLYYVLATPTDEAITDQDLIDALDDFINQAHAYKGHTHITATAADGNAPAVLAVDVNEDNESTVTNAGNTTSRPIITIYGQGDIGLYINDVEVLDIALGDEGYITLDSVEMEAYKDTTANLKNRLVTGDYSKLALNAGANKIRFTGKVTKYEISKYSRWL